MRGELICWSKAKEVKEVKEGMERKKPEVNFSSEIQK